jgi:solute carrier family 25 carnitine/acylcarnitine transporter 20/29
MTDDTWATTSKLLISGGVAGCLSWATVYPLDVVKTIYQVHGVGDQQTVPVLEQQQRRTVQQQLWHIWQQDGIKAYFRGFNVTMVRAFIGKFTVIIASN